jgi:prepilin-type N-terminal cleavage/methylation domain-containing protein
MKTSIRIKGFTLIEMLVVISIIGILATLLLANFNSARGRARDAQRISDMKNMQTALRMYYNDMEVYPGDNGTHSLVAACGVGGTESCVWGTDIFQSTSGQTYIAQLPGDPDEDPVREYKYDQISTDDFYLMACLENKSNDACYSSGDAYLDADPVGMAHVADCVALEGCLYVKRP